MEIKHESIELSLDCMTLPSIQIFGEFISKFSSKIYIVRRLFKLRIYYFWKDCKPQIKYYYNVQFKSFRHYNQVLEFLRLRTLEELVSSNATICCLCFGQANAFVKIFAHCKFVET